MAKCLYCGENVVQADGKRLKLYCNEAHKKRYQRKAHITLKGKLVDIGTSISGQTISGQCWCCGKSIHPKLVCCQECAWSGKAAAKRAGAYPPLLTARTPEQMETDLVTAKPTGGHKMTVMERLFYRPCQSNFVSKPGCACYGVYK